VPRRDRSGHGCRGRRADASRTDAGGDIVFKAENQTWGPVPADDDLAQTQSSDAYAGAFTDPDGHMWQVTRADGVLIR
jgi:uncharacterized protein